MLTKNEKKWLENRGKFPCWYCPNIPQAMCIMGERPAHCAIIDTDWQDATEFSERVAAKLAENTDVSIKAICQAGIHGKSIAWANLKIARLQVEEEMNANRK